MPLAPLPIDPLLPDVLAALAADGSVVLEAPPGTGKTTRVPRACLDAPAFAGREIVLLEPRRLAAKLAAERVAAELGEEVGGQVGYHFRFENVGGPRTRVRFVTEGMFLRRLLADPTLARTAVVIIDEFHERHLQGDLALAWVRRLQTGARPDLKVVVMSATLDGAAVAAYFGCRTIKAEARRFPVDVEYVGDPGRDLDDAVARAVGGLVDAGHRGDTLVFLPGVGEIRRAEAAVKRRVGDDLLVLPLYADLPKREQERAVRPGERQKVVLATNVAETSVTIEGVTAVVDTGLARVAQHNWWSGLPVLRLAKISQASAIQRAGRAGRTAPGRCLRLYGQADFAGRAAFERPEIQRLDLTQPVLELKAMGVADLAAFPWYEAPPAAALEAALVLLFRLGAVDEAGALTPLGERLAALPAHPRLARVALEAARLGVAYAGCTAAAWLGESPGDDPDNEIADLVAAVVKAERGAHNRLSGWHAVDRVRKQLLQALRPPRGEAPGDADARLRRAVLAGFPDRVGRLRAVGKTLTRNKSGEAVEVVLSGGGSARLLNPHLPTGVEYVTALDAEERTQGGLKGDVRLRLVGAVEPDWLLALEPMLVTEKVEVVWNAEQSRAEVLTRLTYDKLTLSESKVDCPGGAELEAAAALLRRKAAEAGLDRFVDGEELAHFRSRLAFLQAAAPDLGVPAWPDVEAAGWDALTQGCTRFSELRDRASLELLRAALPDAVRAKLEAWAPNALQLPGGRRLKIHYEADRPPWAESRLQDFFGMRATPTLAGGRVPLVLHLLAPNQRAVQVTTDLAGFWARHYPALRKELGRRYPKHAWPEDPLTAEPPAPRRR